MTATHTGTVHIDPDGLREMAESATKVADSLGDLADARRFQLAPHVTEAHAELADRWDRHRDELAETLGAAGATSADVADNFHEVDHTLAQILNNPGTRASQAQ